MRFFFCFFLVIFLPSVLWAQNGTISGKVTAIDTKGPLGKASVFLSNATFGTVTAEDGTFTLTGVKPGQYNLVVSILGYETYNQSILVGTKPQQLTIEMMPKPIQMREVVITTSANWKKNYALFIRNFIGTTENAKLCKVLNPHAVYLIYHKKTQTLEASTDEFLEVENRALGYKVRFLIKEFESSSLTSIIRYQGQVLFEELKGSESQKKKWQEKRRLAYYGSSMHFFRALYQQHLQQEGFVIRQLQRRPNPKRLPEEILQQKYAKFNKSNNRDSVNYWNEKAQEPRYIENLIKQPLHEEDVLRRTEQPGLFALTFPDCLYVVYTKKSDPNNLDNVYRPLDLESNATSIITLYAQYALFDLNGVVISPQSTLYEGDWANDKLAELLPVDYAP
ncbi:carboxypeptidase-like regulatory domain-containing protein [uncultured Mucilaginibacter sp.]|uniref:carboxypeptidase-like regulatory domain-containing protein n=1 Tax=uncultured Mucilaginibacter sp. TaxID=797541 RepID=UPI00262F660B|nr:carboxypeptidase-like regulatory domain-containing protein [uncultured Mucilaginibacter sp.]